ncbi:hypothetical protein DRQ53_14765 [bacterium]|nr:MAG: hypothetical protein DRQ53_14765 [bacterium]
MHSTLSHLTDAKWGLASAEIHADTRRENMEDVRSNCHQQSFTDNFFLQYEGLIDLHEEKYAVPGEALYKAAVKALKTNPRYAKFSEPIDYTWFELWHHEGRRARHAASMQAPDYTHWHGTYDLAKNWNSKFLPEIREIIHRFGESAPEEVAALEQLLEETLNSENHRWSINEEDEAVKAEREKRQEEFRAKYKK